MAFVVIGAFLAGWLVRSRVDVPPRTTHIADAYVLRCALPALIFSKISQMEFDGALVTPIVIAWCVMACAAFTVIVVGRIQQWNTSTVGALLLVGVLGNTSFLGLGMVEGLLGSAHLPAAIAYDQIGTFIALAVYGSFVASRWGRDTFDMKTVLRRLFTFVPFIALLLALVARNLSIPQNLYDIFGLIGRTVGPVAMGSLGLRFTLRMSRSVLQPAVFGLAIKMVAVPVLLVLVALWTGNFDVREWEASILQAAMPPMVTAGVVAVGAGMDEDLVAFMVGIGTLVSFVSVPLLSVAL